METLKIINLSNISQAEYQNFKTRKTVRLIIANDLDEIAIMNVASKGFHKFPGGGVEPSEDFESAARREALEEVGVEISELHPLGIITEIIADKQKVQHSYIFRTSVKSYSTNNLTASETDDGYEVGWLPLNEIKKIIVNEGYKNLSGQYVFEREMSIVELAGKR